MKLLQKTALTLLTALALLTLPVLAAGTETTVTTSAEFQAALKDEDVETIRFKGRIIIGPEDGETHVDLDAGTKTILPADPTSNEDQLYFGENVTMLHVSAHDGNRANPDAQSIRNIYGRDYDGSGVETDMDLLCEAAEGWVGWYEYHDAGSKLEDGSPDPYAGKRVCYVLYSGSAQGAVNYAQDLTAGSWKHGSAAPGDENQILFLQFGLPRSTKKAIEISGRDITVTGRTNCFGGQVLMVADKATLTTAELTLETMGEEWGFKDNDSSNLRINSGGKVDIHRWEGEDDRADGAYIGQPQLAVEGDIVLENTQGSLIWDDGAEISCEYHPLAYTASPLSLKEGELTPYVQNVFVDSISEDHRTGNAQLYFYNAGFTTDDKTKEAGWLYDGEGIETLLVTNANGKASQGLIPCDMGEGGVYLFPRSVGEYRVYLYHDPATFGDMWQGDAPTGSGTDIPGTEGQYLTVRVTATEDPSARGVHLEDGKGPNGEAVISVDLPKEVLALAENSFAASYGPGKALEQSAAGAVSLEDGGLLFKLDLDKDAAGTLWRVFLLDKDLRPIVPAMEL